MRTTYAAAVVVIPALLAATAVPPHCPTRSEALGLLDAAKGAEALPALACHLTAATGDDLLWEQIGLAAAQTGEWQVAAVAYARARDANPWSPRLASGLEVAARHSGNLVVWNPPGLLLRPPLWMVYGLSWVSAAAALLAALFRRRRLWRGSAGVALASGFGCAVWWMTRRDWDAVAAEQRGYSGPTAASTPLVTFSQTQLVLVDKHHDDWVRVITAEGQQAWLPRAALVWETACQNMSSQWESLP